LITDLEKVVTLLVNGACEARRAGLATRKCPRPGSPGGKTGRKPRRGV